MSPRPRLAFAARISDLIKVAVVLAQRSRPVTVADCAAATCLPLFRTERALRSLRGAGVVSLQPGRFGGFSLEAPAARTSVLDVLQGLPPPGRTEAACPDLDLLVTRLSERLADSCAAITLADLVTPR